MADADFNVKAIISAQTSQFEKGMKNAQSALQKTSKSIEGVSKLLKGAFSIVGIGAGISAIKSFGTECVRAAESANKSLNILNNTLKVTGATAWTTSEEMVKMSEDIAHSTNYTVGEIQDMQSVLLGFKNITGETFRDASDAITDMATVMGMDLKSAVQTVGKALDDPIKGLDSLKRQGFAFTDQQKEEMKVLVENGEILKAQNMILEELNTTYGGAAKAAQSGFDKQKDAIIEFKETIGNQLMPIMERWAEKSGETFGKLTELVQRIDLATFAAEFETVLDVVAQIVKGIAKNVQTLMESLGMDFIKGENILVSFRNNFYDSLNGVYLIIQDCFGLINALIKGDWAVMWDYMKLIVLRVVKSIVEALSNFQGELKQKFDLLSGVVSIGSAVGMIPKTIATAVQATGKLFDSVSKNSAEILKTIDNEIKETSKDIEEATGHAADISLQNLDNIEQRKKKYVKESKRDDLELVTSATITTNKTNKAWDEFFKDIKEKSENWKETFEAIFSNISGAFSEMFTMLGENLVGAGHSYEDFAAVALESLSQVLSSLGAQLAAIAAVKAMSYSYGEAVAAMAASTAAFTAAGVASGLAKSLTNTKNKVDSIIYTLKDFNSTAAITIQKVKELKENLDSLTTGSQYTTSSYFTEFNAAKKIQEGYVESIAALEKQIQETWDAMDGFERETWKKINYGNAKIYKELKNQLEEAKKGLADIDNYLSTILSNVLDNVKAQGDAINDEINSYKTLYSSYDKAMEYYKKIQDIQNEYGKTSTDFVETLKNMTLMTTALFSAAFEYSDFVKQYKIILQEQKNNILSTINSVVQSLAKSGANIGDAIITSLVEGGTKKDFLTSMKDYIRENLLKLAVYTESFQDRLAEVGTKLTAALLGGGSVKDIRKELEDLWDTASKQAEQAEAIIAEAFGDIQEVVEEAADGVDESLEKIEEKLSSFTEAMNRFKEEVSDLGGDLAGNLIDGLSAGLNQGEFLDNMKKWIRKMLVQSVVYTESMKAEIEAIGQAISKGISEGFTETSFHEIRRDLSWVFNQANQTIEGIDNILNSVFGGGYATGTNNAASGLHLVGEAGPELVKFRGGEQVINAADTNKALSGMGKTINQNITFNNLQDTTAFAMMNQLKQYNRQMAINGVI